MSVCRSYLVIGIGGASNSGKTTVATNLCKALPCAQHMRQDDYFFEPNDPRVERDEDGLQDWDRLSALDMTRMVTDVQQWIETQRHNTSKSKTSVLIIEGFLIFNHSALSNLFDQKYFIIIDKETSAERRKLRVYNPPDPPGYFEKTVWPNYIKHLAALEDHTNIEYIDGMADLDTLSQTISSRIQKALE